MRKRWGTPQNVFLAYIDELEKRIIIKKNCWSGPIKNKINLIFMMLHFLKKKLKKNTCRYSYQNLNDMIYSSWDIEENILKLVILGHFLKNEKTCSRYHHFTHVYQKSQSFDVWFLRYEVRWTEFFAISSHFLPFYQHSPSPPPTSKDSKNQNFEEKNVKNAWRCYPFIHTYVP